MKLGQGSHPIDLQSHDAYIPAQDRELVRRQVLEALKSYDVLILPASKGCAPILGDDPVITSKEMAAGLPPVMTRSFNLADAQALSLNCEFNSQGLPIGLQIGGRHFDEETMLKVGHAYEKSTSWRTTRSHNA
ncbi:MAG: amidase family protein [Chloroflexi bacterium]|nr:amidase family protein [Chloroflexota bacterium]